MSSVGQIVGLIEIEPAGGQFDAIQPHEQADHDRTVAQLLAYLAGYPIRGAEPCSSRIERESWPANRLALVAAAPSLYCSIAADLTSLATELADEADRFRRQADRAVAGSRSVFAD